MTRYSRLGLSFAMLVLMCGCVPMGDYYTVPWWKGVPTSLIAPNSLEAMAWKEQHQDRHQHPPEGDPVYLSEVPHEDFRDSVELR